MARRAKGEGSVRKRPEGRWEARLTVDGKARSFFGATQREALHKMRDAQRRAEQHLPIPPAGLTMAAFLEQWLAAKKPTMRPDSWARYEVRCRIHVNPELGKIRLQKLQPDDLRKAYAAIAANVSGTTVAHIHGMLHTALQDALREGLVGRNVASLVKGPQRSTKEMRALQPAEAKQLLAAAEGDAHQAFYTILLTTGVRLGEAQALMWGDINWNRGRLTVRRTLADDGKPVFSPTSTRKNHQRVIWLSGVAIGALERQRDAQEAQRLAAADAWHEHALVFTNGVGNPLDGRNLRRRSFPQLLAKAGLPHFRIHDLRHSSATLLLSEGVPVKVVSEMLGHADVSTTLRIYAHVLEGAQEQATTVMDQLFHA